MSSLTAEDIKALNNISSINDFETFDNEFEKLRAAIQASTLGTDNNNDIGKRLNDLKERIEPTLDEFEKSRFDSKFDILKKMAEGAIRGAFTKENIAAALQNRKKYYY